jgi:hypothetical protein
MASDRTDKPIYIDEGDNADWIKHVPHASERRRRRMHRFPFGRPVEPMPPTQNRGGLFILGAYPSALHVRWRAPEGPTINALAIENEPAPFWNGDDQERYVESWKQAIGFTERWGIAEPAGHHNGSSGRWVDERLLGPLGFTREQTWITDCLDTYRVSDAQTAAITERFLPFAAKVGEDVEPNLPAHPDEDAIVREAKKDHIERVDQELRQAEPTTVVTLGNAALRVFRLLLRDDDPYQTDGLSTDGYGRRVFVSLHARPLDWYPLVHPGGRGPIQDAHTTWIAERATTRAGSDQEDSAILYQLDKNGNPTMREVPASEVEDVPEVETFSPSHGSDDSTT